MTSIKIPYFITCIIQHLEIRVNSELTFSSDWFHMAQGGGEAMHQLTTHIFLIYEEDENAFQLDLNGKLKRLTTSFNKV